MKNTILNLPVYIINLERDSQRRKHILNEVKAAQLTDNIVHIGAVYGKHLPCETYNLLYNQEKNKRHFSKPLTPGEVGCYASHLECWKKISQGQEPLALIIEDDIKISPEIGPILQGIASSGILFDMIKLVGRNKESALKKIVKIQNHTLIDYFKIPNYTGAYLISREGAKKLVASRHTFFRPVDVDLRHWWELGDGFLIYGIQPYPIEHAHFESTIGERRFNRLFDLSFLFKRIKTQIIYQLKWAFYTTKKFIKNQ